MTTVRTKRLLSVIKIDGVTHYVRSPQIALVRATFFAAVFQDLYTCFINLQIQIG
jgi:hypothetical protein